MDGILPPVHSTMNGVKDIESRVIIIQDLSPIKSSPVDIEFLNKFLETFFGTFREFHEKCTKRWRNRELNNLTIKLFSRFLRIFL